MTFEHNQECEYMGDSIVLCWDIYVVARYYGQTIQTIHKRTRMRGVFRTMERSYVVRLYVCGEKVTNINEGDT